MTEPLLDLLGDPLPEPLPENIQLTEIESLVGHTIRAAIEHPGGRVPCDFLLITATGCWMGFEAEIEDFEDGTADCNIIKRRRHHHVDATPWVLTDFASPLELLNAEIITEGECTQLQAIEKERRNNENAARIARLRADADRLEKGL